MARTAGWREIPDIIHKALPSNNPSPEDIARVHELHARHERKLGRPERSAIADEQARKVG
jgi:hypothetical protein